MKKWIFWGRVLWVVLALNSLVLFGMTLYVNGQLLAQPSPRITAGLAEQGLSLAAYNTFFVVGITLFFVVYALVALVIFVRLPNDGFALFVAIFLLNYGAANAYPQYVEFVHFYIYPPIWYRIPALISSLFSWPLLVTFLVVYPDGQFVPRWTRYACVYGAAFTLAWTVFPNLFSDPTNPFAIVGAASVLIITGATLYAQIWRYRHHSSGLQRQQTKWFLYALGIFVVATVLEIVPPLFQSSQSTAGVMILGDLATTFGTVIFVVLPLAVGIAILRYRLWDIDLLIRRTVTYSLVTVTLLVIYFVSIVVLQRVFSQLTGQTNSEIVTVVSTLGIAALFVPVRNRIQGVIDRRFNRNKYDAQKILEQFAVTVRDETDLEKLSGELVSVVNETMQPKRVELILRAGQRQPKQEM